MHHLAGKIPVAVAAITAFLFPAVPASAAGDSGGGQAHAGYGRPYSSAGHIPSPFVSAPTGYTVDGIDVSHFQGAINWSQVAASGEKFAYIKVTDNTGAVDPAFGTNYYGAKNAGLYAGAYHFALPDRSTGTVQADFFLDHAQYAHDGHTLPPMLDIEWPWDGSNSPSPCYGMTPGQMVTWIRAFVTEVQKRTGVSPTIYTNPNWWNPCTGNSTAFATLPLDHAAYATSPGTLPAGWSTFTFWQYTSSGTVPGISGVVDRDAFHGTLSGLATLAGKPIASTPSDFDSDRRSDLTLYRGDGTWNVKSVATAATLYGGYPLGGDPSEIPLTGDFDGDGYADVAVYRRSQGLWWISSPHRGVPLAVSFPYGGSATDIPLAGDFDGDGTDDVALYRPSNGTWWAKSISRNVQIFGGYPYGGDASDVPVTGDFDGDGYTDIALYRRGQGTWWVKSPHRGVQLAGGYPYGGNPTDIPLAGDFDHDGKDDITLYRPSNGTWWVKSPHRGVQIIAAQPFGGDPTDRPPAG
jgi:GH25 family lysozyme M1 (1,4-beta-N-acetylmuramidase)